MQKITQNISENIKSNRLSVSYRDDSINYPQISDQQFKLYSKETLDIPYGQSLNNIHINVGQPSQKGTGIQRYTVYKVSGQDKNGTWEIFRRYSQFYALREILTSNWPGIYIPAIPNKQILNKTDEQLTKNRIRFLNSFVKKIASFEYLYQSEQFQIFIKNQEEISKSLLKIKRQSNSQLVKKYANTFKQFLDNKNFEQSKQKLQIFNLFIKDNKKNLAQFRKQARQLAESRQKYNLKLFYTLQKILPQYQNLILSEFSKIQPDFIFKNPQKYLQSLNIPQVKQVVQKNPFWLIYDLIKFEQRQLQAFSQAYNGLLNIKKKIQEILDDMKINEKQIESLQNGKTTLRSLLRKGNKEQMKGNLTKKNEQLQKQRQISNELLNIVGQYLIKFIDIFKNERQRFFNKVIIHTFSYQMNVCKCKINYFDQLTLIALKNQTKQ